MNDETPRDEMPGQALRGNSLSQHVSEVAWEALACGELDPNEREEALRHIGRCEECDRIYRALVELHAQAVEFDPNAPAVGPTGTDTQGGRVETREPEIPPSVPMHPRFARSRYTWLGLAAAAVLVVAIVFPRPEVQDEELAETAPTSTPRITVRSGGHTAAYDEPIALSPVGRLSSPNPMIRWTPVDEVESYTVEIFDESGALVWVSESTLETETLWPTLDATPVRLSWRVRARIEGGLREELSEPAFVELPPAPEPAS